MMYRASAGGAVGSIVLLCLAAAAGGGVRAPLDSRLPVLLVATPKEGARVAGTVAVSGRAHDNVRVASVEVRVDQGRYVRASGTSSWSVRIRTSVPTGHAPAGRACHRQRRDPAVGDEDRDVRRPPHPGAAGRCTGGRGDRLGEVRRLRPREGRRRRGICGGARRREPVRPRVRQVVVVAADSDVRVSPGASSSDRPRATICWETNDGDQTPRLPERPRRGLLGGMDRRRDVRHHYGGSWRDVPWDPNTWDRFESNAGKPMSIVHWGVPRARGSDDFNVFRRSVQPRAEPGSDQPRRHGHAATCRSATSQRASTTARTRAWAQQAKAWGHPWFLRWNARDERPLESVGDDRANINTPADFVAAWRHVHDIFARSERRT